MRRQRLLENIGTLVLRLSQVFRLLGAERLKSYANIIVALLPLSLPLGGFEGSGFEYQKNVQKTEKIGKELWSLTIARFIVDILHNGTSTGETFIVAHAKKAVVALALIDRCVAERVLGAAKWGNE